MIVRPHIDVNLSELDFSGPESIEAVLVSCLGDNCASWIGNAKVHPGSLISLNCEKVGDRRSLLMTLDVNQRGTLDSVYLGTDALNTT
jgi:hypothetical protein